MAKIKKLYKKTGKNTKELIYPATITQAIKDGETGQNLHDYMNDVKPKFKFNATKTDGQLVEVGSIQLSQDGGKTWNNISPEFINNLRIQKYVATASALPSGQPVGTIYAVGPIYDAADTSQTNPIYTLYVYDGNQWVNNGKFTSIAAGVVQKTGDSETQVMSQNAVTKEFFELSAEIRNKIDKKVGKNLFNANSTNIIDGYFIHPDGYLAPNSNYLVSEYIKIKPNTNYYLRKSVDNINWQTYDKDSNILTTSNTQAIQTESSAKYIRVSVLKTDAQIQQLEEGTSFTSYEPYIDNANSISERSLMNKSVSNRALQENSVGDKNLINRSVSFEKIGFSTSGKNLVNKNDKDVAVGYYIYQDTILANDSYTTSGFIKVTPGESYIISRNGIRISANFLGYYDANKNYLSITRDVYSFTAPENAEYIRISILNQHWNLLQIEKGNTITSYEEYYSHIGKKYLETTLDIDAVSTENIKEKAVTPNKTSFFKRGNNLVDINSINVAYGKYVTTTGALYENSAYNTTDYIPVTAGKTYRIGASDAADLVARTIATFDENFKVTENYFSNTSTIIIPEGVHYIRASLYIQAWEYAQITEGEDKIPYEKFAVIDSNYLPISSNSVETNVTMYVPKHIYVAAGRTIELYYDQIILNAYKYNIQAICQIGKAMDRKFQIIGDLNKIGNYTLTIKVINDNGDVVASDTGTIHIVSNSIENSYSIVPFGDSLTNDKPWLNEVASLSGNKIVMKGTRHNKHEGRSGGSVTTYLSKTGGLLYNYDNFYSGIGLDAPIFDDSVTYNEDDLVRYPTTFGIGITGYHVYAFKNAHNGAWDTSDVVCISGGNPLYDYKNNKISLNFYKSFQSISCDAIILYLGTNGISLSPETNANGSLGIKNLIDEIRSEDTTTPIIVVNTIFRSSQNGIGSQGNTDGYKAQTAFKFEEDKKVLLLAKSINELIGSYDNVYIAPVGATHDSKYNFGNKIISVNPRLEATDAVHELQPLDSVHPQNSGYYQMADTIYSTICAIINK